MSTNQYHLHLLFLLLLLTPTTPTVFILIYMDLVTIPQKMTTWWFKCLFHTITQLLIYHMWKYIEGVDLPPLTSIGCSHGLLFNEAIHWVAQNWVDGKTTDFIIAFDLMEKRLLKIPQPHDFHDVPNLWVYGRYFSLSVQRRDFTCEIWVMKKYKVQTSWTKTLVLSFNHYFHFPECSTKGGDIVMSTGHKLTKYSEEGVVQGEQLEPQNHSSYCGFLNPSASLYTESMLSLPDVSD
ncbi:uncharacterized protein LOC130743000 [Lotus japonicus]|uniref:uncharacterized protein LOC130743000 n=1 Tax=Lotus japonicus TaxID=34305 RepID=UPI0025879AE0|nr:uncharacterized protein LOC130743000 [Lotus japonicus]XP_057451093.1 uncharacterized protein LOC130743000 [Lotus japonicus]